jgi:hypothetical protein
MATKYRRILLEKKKLHKNNAYKHSKQINKHSDSNVYRVYNFFNFYFSTFIAHYPRVSSKRFTFTLTLLARLLG